jgi:hypothetical protein
MWLLKKGSGLGFSGAAIHPMQFAPLDIREKDASRS